LLAPLASIPAVVLSGLGSSDAGAVSDLFWGLFFAIALVVPASYLGMALVGLPIYLLLRKFNLLRPWITFSIGALLPLVLFVNTAPFRTTLVAVSAGIAVAIAAHLLLPQSADSSQLRNSHNDA
jgi:hypothetical protein